MKIHVKVILRFFRYKYEYSCRFWSHHFSTNLSLMANFQPAAGLVIMLQKKILEKINRQVWSSDIFLNGTVAIVTVEMLYKVNCLLMEKCWVAQQHAFSGFLLPSFSTLLLRLMDFWNTVLFWISPNDVLK